MGSAVYEIKQNKQNKTKQNKTKQETWWQLCSFSRPVLANSQDQNGNTYEPDVGNKAASSSARCHNSGTRRRMFSAIFAELTIASVAATHM